MRIKLINRLNKSIALLSLLFFLVLPFYSKAGGLYIDKESLRFNGYKCGATLETTSSIKFSFRAQDYSYSGHYGEYVYIIFSFSNVITGKTYFLLVSNRDYAYSDKNYGNDMEKEFLSPEEEGHYIISYCPVKLFIQRKVDEGRLRPIQFFSNDIQRILSTFHKIELCNINFNNDDINNNDKLEVYLNVNNVLPQNARINPGLNGKPINFSWYVKKAENCSNILYRYKIEPEDDKWSPWQEEKNISVYFLNRGFHKFSLECRYTFNYKLFYSPEVLFTFSLNEPFYSQPKDNEITLDKEITYIDKGG